MTAAKKTAKATPAVARAVVPRIGGQFVLTPEGFTIRATLRSSLETYLAYREDGVPEADEPQFMTLQRQVDRLLGKVVKGEDPAKVFRLEPKKRRGERKDVAREQALCLEVLRLTMLHAVRESDATDDVAGAFAVDVRMVQRAVKAWREDPRFSRGDISTYERSLIVRKFLP